MDHPPSFGDWLRRRRRELDLTQEALAGRVGCARVTIRKLEAEEIRPSRQLAELLAEKLDLPPQDREAFVRLGRGAPAGLAAFSPALPGPPPSLPHPPSSFIGRERELATVRQLLGQARLVTLTGAGGIGKTRLALEGARAQLSAYRDGVWWVELAPLRDAELLAKAVAKAGGVGESANQPVAEALLNDLQSRQLLLVLDNCEHLIMACAQLVDQVLSDCPGVRILATSREALDIVGETVWQVPSLTLPDRQLELPAEALSRLESVRLFVDRARLVQPEFELTTHNLRAAAHICQRLSGIPLAIELAAARVKLLSADEIARRLDDCFDLLTAGSRTALPRHRTLRATIDWSFELLSEPERALFRRLSVFAGGFTLEAAEAAMCDRGTRPAAIHGQPVLALLGQLVNKSLVHVEQHPEDQGWTSRYQMLETVREYARENLAAAGEAGLIQDQHLDYFAGLAEVAEPEIFSPRQMMWFYQLEMEIDNLRAAVQRSVESDVTEPPERLAWRREAGLRLMGALVWFFERAYQQEACARLERMLAEPASPGSTTAAPTHGRAKALTALGFLQWEMNRFAESRARLEEALPIFRQLDDSLGLIWALAFHGWAAIGLRELELAQASLAEGIALAKSLGASARPALGVALAFHGDILAQQGQDDTALAYYQQSVDLLVEAGEKNFRGHPVRQIGYIALRRGDLKEAKAMFSESLADNLEVGHRVGIIAAVLGLAALALQQQRYAHAATLAGAVETHLGELNAVLFVADDLEYRRFMAGLRAALPAGELDAALGAGRGLDLKHTLELSLASDG